MKVCRYLLFKEMLFILDIPQVSACCCICSSKGHSTSWEKWGICGGCCVVPQAVSAIGGTLNGVLIVPSAETSVPHTYFFLISIL